LASFAPMAPYFSRFRRGSAGFISLNATRVREYLSGRARRSDFVNIFVLIFMLSLPDFFIIMQSDGGASPNFCARVEFFLTDVFIIMWLEFMRLMFDMICKLLWWHSLPCRVAPRRNRKYTQHFRYKARLHAC
jgi:hypothetical protein